MAQSNILTLEMWQGIKFKRPIDSDLLYNVLYLRIIA